jgi:hypothetical protein
METKQTLMIGGLPPGWMDKCLELSMEDPPMALRLARLAIGVALYLEEQEASSRRPPKETEAEAPKRRTGPKR